MLRWLIVAALASLSIGVAAADRPPPIPSDFMYVFDSVDLLKDRSRPLMGLRQGLSLVGRDDLIIDRVYDADLRPKCTPAMQADGEHVDPNTEIVKRAKLANRLVIVNEAHDDAQTRAFIMDLLPPLGGLGYSIYAAETFTPSVGRRAPKWPLLSDGYYSDESTYGELMRRARTLKFDFVPYEIESSSSTTKEVLEQIAERETAQSRNIHDRIVKPVPHGKALIHVGYSHLNEEPIKWGDGPKMVEWMASRLKKLSGVDPLTVDQTTFQSPLDRPVVCALANENEKKRAARADITIALPAPVIARGRPTWRRAQGQVEVTIPAAVRPRGKWTIVEARYAEEPADAVPVDRLMLRPDEDLPLLLKPGKYRTEGWTRENGWTEAADVVVER